MSIPTHSYAELANVEAEVNSSSHRSTQSCRGAHKTQTWNNSAYRKAKLNAPLSILDKCFQVRPRNTHATTQERYVNVRTCAEYSAHMCSAPHGVTPIIAEPQNVEGHLKPTGPGDMQGAPTAYLAGTHPNWNPPVFLGSVTSQANLPLLKSCSLFGSTAYWWYSTSLGVAGVYNFPTGACGKAWPSPHVLLRGYGLQGVASQAGELAQQLRGHTALAEK